MPSITSTFHFNEKASPPKNAAALVFDLEGFSRFFNQPDVQDYIPAFLNHVSEAISLVLFGGLAYWMKESTKPQSPLRLSVAHEKFLGDGALYILLPSEGEPDLSSTALRLLCNRLWNLKNHFDRVMHSALDKVPVAELPRRIRFGLSRGTVYELTRSDAAAPEYIGFCVNLASRLQRYCNALGFIASARLLIPTEELNKHGYKKVIATNLRGFSDEIVIVDSDEFDALDEETKHKLFKELEDA